MSVRVSVSVRERERVRVRVRVTERGKAGQGMRLEELLVEKLQLGFQLRGKGGLKPRLHCQLRSQLEQRPTPDLTPLLGCCHLPHHDLFNPCTLLGLSDGEGE